MHKFTGVMNDLLDKLRKSDALLTKHFCSINMLAITLDLLMCDFLSEAQIFDNKTF